MAVILINKNLVIILFISFILRFPSIYTQIIDIDESQYGQFALQVMAGNLPYKEVVGEKFPFSYYYFFWIFTLFGKNNYYAVHFVTSLIVILTIIFLYKIAKSLFDERTALLNALFYAIFSTTHEPKIISTNGEIIMNLPIVVGVYLFLVAIDFISIRFKFFDGRAFFKKINDRVGNNDLKISFLLLSALVSGIAILFRHQAIFQIAFLSLFMFIFFFKRMFFSFRKFFLYSFYIIAFLFFAFLPLILSFYWAYYKGVLSDFYFWTIEFNFRYVDAGGIGGAFFIGFYRIFLFVIFNLPLWIFFFRFFYLNFLNKSFWLFDDKSKFLLIFSFLWLIFSFYPVFIGSRFFTHYFIQCFPALCFIASISVVKYFPNLIANCKYFVFAFLNRKFFLFLLLYSSLFLFFRVSPYLTHFIIKNITPSQSKMGIYPEQKLVSQYIKKRSSKDDFIFVWGFATPIYTYSNRNCGSRFLWADLLSGRIPGKPFWENHSLDKSKKYILSNIWAKFCKDMNKFQPIYFIDTSTGNYHEYGIYPTNKTYNKFNLGDFIKNFYIKEKIISNITIYKLNKTINLNCNF